MHTSPATDQPLPATGAGDDETWRIRRTAADLNRLGETESIFALGNGWVGWRGVLDEGAPCAMPGSYLNGFHERHELSYPEEGYAFPQASDTVISAPNAAAGVQPALARAPAAGHADPRRGPLRAARRRSRRRDRGVAPR